MKIKIKRHLKERYGFSPTSDLPIDDLFDAAFKKNEELQVDKEQIETIFNKDLVFYDLETTGLRRSAAGLEDDGATQTEDFTPSDAIHQIACIRYTTGGDMDKLSPEKPTDAYIAKCEIPPELLAKTDKIKTSRAFILNQTDSGSYAEYKKLIPQKKDGTAGDTIVIDINNVVKTLHPNKDEKFIKSKGSEGVAAIQGLFFHIFLNYQIKSKKEGRLKNSPDEKMIRMILKFCANKDTLGAVDGETLEQRIKKIIKNKNPTFKELFFLFETVFDDSGEGEDVGRWYKEKGDDYAEKQAKRYALMVDITVEENKVFTHYDSFPLEKYQTKSHYPAQGITTEKEALVGMMNYFDNLGSPAQKDPPVDGDYILVGQNIISFDNPFVLARCKHYGITNISTFQNSRVYDTRFLFSTMVKYFKNLVYFYNLGGAGPLSALQKRFESTTIAISELEKQLNAAKQTFDGWLKDNKYTKALTKAELAQLSKEKKEEYDNVKVPYKALKQQIDSYKKFPADFKNFQNIVSGNREQIKNDYKKAHNFLVDLTAGGRPRAKLSTLMKAFIKVEQGQKAPKQTHTADDDCEKLAMVLIPALKAFKEIFDNTKDYVLQIDQIKNIQRYRTAKFASKAVRAPLYDPVRQQVIMKKGKNYDTQAQKTASGLKFDKPNVTSFRKKVANKIYNDLEATNNLIDRHKGKDNKEAVLKFLIGNLSKQEGYSNVEELKPFLDQSTQDSIRVYKLWTEPPITENKNRIKIKILRENKSPKNNKKFKKIIIKEKRRWKKKK